MHFSVSLRFYSGLHIWVQELLGHPFLGDSGVKQLFVHPGQINARIYVTHCASAQDHTESKAMLVFVLQWATYGETLKGCLQ